MKNKKQNLERKNSEIGENALLSFRRLVDIPHNGNTQGEQDEPDGDEAEEARAHGEQGNGYASNHEDEFERPEADSVDGTFLHLAEIEIPQPGGLQDDETRRADEGGDAGVLGRSGRSSRFCRRCHKQHRGGTQWENKNLTIPISSMDLSSFVQTFFIDPMWDRTGYNMVNTLTYAAIVITALYFIWKFFEKRNISIDRAFWAGALAFVLFGSSLRVLTDAVDAGIMAKTLMGAQAGAGGWFGGIAQAAYPFLLSSRILDYGPLTVTPGIYVMTAFLFLGFIALGWKMKQPYLAAGAGLAGGLLNLLLLLPMMKHWDYAMLDIGLMLLVGAIAYFVLKYKDRKHLLPVMGQALDGAATWIAIDFFGPASGNNYFEQHVLSSAIGTSTPLGFGLFFLLKIGFASLAVWAIRKEDLDERVKSLVLLVITIIGFAPGLRDLLRMLCGT